MAAKCPKCVDRPLINRWQQKSRPLRTLCGPVVITRTGGYCKSCDQNYYPADASLGLSGESTASPLLQEVSALLVSKMPAEQAEEISQRVCGIRLNDASLARDARRQGDRAIAMLPELHAEAMRRGLPWAERILILADGAVWIWNAAKDRFPGAVLRLDLFHANAYLWAVANELHGAGTAEARKWVKPLLRQVREDQTPAVIAELKELLPTLTAAQAKKVNTTVEYYSKNIDRMKYTEADLRNEPVGSGTIESTCRQYQCRMKRCGQFWSQLGDEALLTLDTFWRNGYWGKLFPHAQLTHVSRN